MSGAAVQEWDATSVPVADRADAVRHALGRTHLPWQLQFGPGEVRCSLSTHQLADGALVECRSGLVAGRRGPQGLTGEDEQVGLLLVLEGREQVRQDDVVVDLGPGDALLWRSGRPASFRVCEPLHKVTLMLPAARLGGLAPSPVALPAGRATTGLLAAHLRSLAGLAGGLSPIDAAFMVDVALDLVRRTVRPDEADDGARGRLRRRAVELVEAHLEDPLLSPRGIADTLGVSARWLHEAFADSGETVASHIRRRRLERVRRDLSDPGQQATTVTTIAFRHGFTDAATLSRQFRATFGTTPTAFRRGHR